MSKKKKTTRATPVKEKPPAEPPASTLDGLAGLHCRIGWWSLLLFLTLGSVLETLHWLDLDWFVDAAHETRRLMWRLAHAHGTLLGLVHLGFGLTCSLFPHLHGRLGKFASRCLLGAGILLPGGFFLGGVVIHGGDPGLGILLVPLGALLLFVAVLVSALACSGSSPTNSSGGNNPDDSPTP